MIIPITRQNIDLLEKCRAGLQRTLDKTDLKECWDIDALYDHVVNFSVFAFYQEESGLAGVLSVNTTPRLRILNWFWTGKDPASKVLPDYAEVDAFLVHMATELGCGRLVCDGRKGWEKIGAPFGYQEDGRVYVKSIGG